MRQLCWSLLPALVFALAFSGCSIGPEYAGLAPLAGAEAAGTSAAPGPGAIPPDLQPGSKVKADAFNDQATGTEIPRQGGQIVVRFNAEPQTLSTWLSTTDAYAQYISGEYIYDTLLWQNRETYQFEPNLAERWIEEDVVVLKDGSLRRGTAAVEKDGDVVLRTSSGDTTRLAASAVKEVRKGASFTFFLRQNVRFHDGVPLTAADVKFSIDTIKNENVDAPDMRVYFNDVASYEVLGPYTIRITYGKQYWYARYVVGLFEILPKHLYDADNLQERDPAAFGKRFNESPYHRAPVGTGPYKFERWETGRQVVLRRNDDYWNPRRRGHLDRIIFRFISDNVASLQALKNGEVDFIQRRITPEQFDRETNSPQFLRKFVKVEYYVGGFLWVGWNMRRPPFDDVRVRQAMAYGALNKEEFLQKFLHGRGVLVSGYENYFGPGYDHSIAPYPYDPEKARELLVEAGWYDRDGDGLRDKNGQPFRFEFLMPAGDEAYRARAALMKENLRQLGIDMTIRELEWATFIQNIADRKFDACTLRWATNIEGDPYQLWHTSQSENRGSNYVGFGTPETDRLIEATQRAIDDNERKALFYKFHKVLHDQQPYDFLYMEPELGAYNKKYRGVKFYRMRPGYDLTEWFIPEGVS